MSLLPNTTYYYRVKAVTSEQESDYSDVIAVTTLPSDTSSIATVAPSNPEIFRINTFSNRAEVYLQLPFAGEAVEEYKVTVSSNSDYSSPICNALTYVINKNTNYAFVNQIRYISLTIPNLTASTLYYFKITASNSIALSGNTATTFTTESVLSAPIAVGVGTLTTTAARLMWTAVTGVTSYRVSLATNSNFTSPILDAVTSSNVNDFYDFTALSPSTTYFAKVQAVQNSIVSKFSNTISFTTLATGTADGTLYNLTSPVIAGARNLFTNTFELYWYTVDRAVSYSVDLSISPTFASFVSQNLTTTNTFYTFAGLNAGTVYYVRLRAVEGVNLSSYSASTIVTLSSNGNLSAPQLIPPSTIFSTGFVITWVKRNYATGYAVDISNTSNFSSVLRRIYTTDIDSLIIDNLTASTTYYARIYGLTSTESSVASSTLTVTTAANLPSITLASTTDLTDATARLNWSTNAAYTKYYLSIYKKINFATITEGRTNFLGDGFFEKRLVGNINTYLVDLFLEASTTYSYFITGETASGDTRNSAIADFTTQAQAPVIQISSGGKTLEWSGNLTQIEVSTDREFKSLVQGWCPRTVTNTGSFDITPLMLANTCYYIRGYDVLNGVKGRNSNTVSTFSKTPLWVPATVAKTTATVRWKKNQSTSYSLQLMIDDGAGNYNFVAGFTLPVIVGDADSYQFTNLIANRNYAAYLNWFDSTSNKYIAESLPVYFKTNRYGSVNEITTSGTAPTGTTTTSSYDRIRITAATSGTYLVEVSRRSTFIPVEQYIEIEGTTVDIFTEPNTTYYIRLYQVTSGVKTSAQTLTVTTSNLPAYATSLTVATTITSTNIVNSSEAIIQWQPLSDATGYTVEVSGTSAFNLLDKYSVVTYLNSIRVLISGLSSAKVYYVRVYGYNDNSISPYSNVVSISTQ